MRVIAGTAKGRRLVAPRGSDTRPTSDRVKEAVFSSLEPMLRGARVLDLFAGSGALAIEALSRGTAHAVLVEQSRPALDAIRMNLAATGVADRATVVAASLPAALQRPAVTETASFDVVLLDPPYAMPRDALAQVLEGLPALLADGAEVRLEQAARGHPPPWPSSLLPGRVRRYGDTTIHEATAQEPPA